MDLGFAHALALVAHGDAWLRADDDAPPPLPCLEIPSLGCAMGPSFVPSGVREPLAGAEGLWYGWLRDHGAMRLRLTTAPWRTRRATKTGMPGGEVRLATEEGAALLVTYHDRHELWLPAWRRRPAARAWSPGCWAVTYKGRPGGVAPGVPGVPVSAAAALGAAIASTRRDLRERGDERWDTMLEEAWDHLCASSPPSCRRLELLPTDGYGDGARRLLAAAVSTLEASDDLQDWVMGGGDFYEDRSKRLHAIAIAALVTATNAGGE